MIINRLKVGGWKKIYCVHSQSYKSWNGYVRHMKKTSRAGTFNRGKEEYFIFNRESMNEEDMTLVSVYAP